MWLKPYLLVTNFDRQLKQTANKNDKSKFVCIYYRSLQ